MKYVCSECTRYRPCHFDTGDGDTPSRVAYCPQDGTPCVWVVEK